MHIIVAMLTLCLLSACAVTTAEVPGTAAASTGHCAADGLATFVGQKATHALGGELLAKSGARTLRWGPPRSAMTMDFREDRLTVAYDDDMIITSANCG